MRLQLTTLALLAAAWMTTGCGPGTGGTGDGHSQVALQVFGATPAAVCASSFSAALACTSAGMANPDPQGTTMVYFADTLAGSNLTLSLQGNQLELSARCQDLQFKGDWGLAANDDARFFGTYTAKGAASAPASLTMQSASPGGDVIALLRAIDGRVLLGPVLLQRVASPASNPAACPA